VIILLKQLKTS